MALSYLKRPTEVASYTLDWSERLPGADTIAGSVWAAEIGITIDSDSFTNTTATVILSVGTAGGIYTVTNTVTTAAGLELVQEILIHVPTTLLLEIMLGLKAYAEIGKATDDLILYVLARSALVATEDHCKRILDPVTATRYYLQEAQDTEDPFMLWLDEDLQSITTLTNGDSTVILAADYWLMPRHGPPYQGIKLKINGSSDWQWDTDGWVSVAGIWAYADPIPMAIEQAIKRWALFFYKQRDSPVFDVQAIPDAGVILVPQGIPADVARLLGPHKKGKGIR